MDKVAKCGNYLLISVNSFFGFLGLTFLVVGCFLKFNPSMISGLLNSALASFKDAAPGGYLDDLDMTKLLSGAATSLIVIGSILVAIAIWAYIGACCKIKWMLIVYVCFIVLVFLGEVVAIVIITRYRYVIDDPMKTTMKEAIKTKYTGDNGTDSTTLAWNALMGLLKCCGADGMEDFAETSAWDKTYTYSSTTIIVEAPVLCCETISDECSSVSTSPTNTYNKGCYQALWDLIETYKYWLIGILSGIGVLHLLLVFLVVWLIRALWKTPDNKVAPSEGGEKGKGANF